MDLTELREKLAADPADFKTFEAGQKTLLENGQLEELGELYQQVVAALGDAPERDRILRLIDVQARTNEDEEIKSWVNLQLGQLYWQTLDNADRAEVYFRRIKDREDAQDITAKFYEKFYLGRDNWRRLEQFLVERGDEAIAVKQRLADMAEKKDNPEKAIGFLQAVYSAGEGGPGTFDRLRALYETVGKWHSLVELLKSQLKTIPAEDTAAVVAVHMDMLTIYRDQIKSDTRVISTWQQILKLQPDNGAALDALQSLYEEMQRWPDLVRILQSRVTHMDNPSERLPVHRRIATLMLDRFSNSSEAIKQYTAILDIDADDLEALGKLKVLYEERKNWDLYVSVARREISLTNEGDENAILDLARLVSERIRHPAIAIELWEDVVAVRPDDPEALEQLESLYEREKKFDRLLEVMDARFAHLKTTEEQQQSLEKMGFILGTRLSDPDRAADVWGRLLELQPGHRKAFNEVRKRAVAAKDFAVLEELFRQHATIAELIRTLETEANQLEGTSKIGLLERVAALSTEAEQPTRTIKALEAIMALEPRHLGAANGLLSAYERQNAWKKLPDVYDVVLEQTSPGKARKDLLLRKCALYEEKLRDKESAFFSSVEAYKEYSQDEAVQSNLERLTESSGNWEVYASVLEQVAQRHTDEPSVATALLLRVAEVMRTHLNQPLEALTHYQDILGRFDPQNATALAATEQIYRDTQQWDELVDVLHAKLDRGGLSTSDEKSLRLELAAVWRDQLDEPEAAMGVYRELMTRFPDELSVYDELANLHLQLEDWDRLDEVLRRKLSRLVDDGSSSAADLANLHCRLGMLAYSARSDIGTAVEHYTDALVADGECSLAVQCLEELLASDTHRGAIARVLEPVYRASEQWSSVADALEIQLADTGAKRGQTRLLNSLIRLYTETLEDSERALWASVRMMRLDPNKKSLHAGIESLVESLGDWSALVALYEAEAEHITDDELRLSILNRAATVAREQLNDGSLAERLFIRILDEDSSSSLALDALESIYLESDNSEQLLGILRKKEALCESVDERIEYRFQTASILTEQLQRLDDAVDDMLAVLDWQPGHVMALARLDDLYGRSEQWDRLHDVLGMRIDVASSPEEQCSLMVRRATLALDALDMPERAIETYANVLALDSTHEGAVGALEGLLGDDTLAAAVAKVLRGTYESSDNWQGLIRVTDVLQSAADSPSEKESLLFQLAKLHEERGESAAQAYECLGRAYRLSPDTAQTVSELLRLANQLGNHEDLVALLASGVDDANDPTRRREIHRVLAQLFLEKCGDSASAVTHYQQVLELDDEDMPAIDALTDLYRSQGAMDSLVSTLRRKATLSPIDELKVELLQEAGEIATNALSNAELAVEIFEDILRLMPGQESALTALEPLYEQGEQWGLLCDVLNQKIEGASEDEQRIVLARRIAAVQQQNMSDLDSAIASHRRILQWAANDVAALAALDALLSETEQWHDLIPILDQQITLSEPEPSLVVGLRKADVYSAELSDAVSAIQVLRALLATDSNETRVHSALERLIRESDSREEAFSVLNDVLVAREEHERLVVLLDVLVTHREHADDRIEALHRMGGLTEEQLQDPGRAFVCFGRALRERSDHADSMAAVERLAAANGLWEEFVTLLGEVSEESADPQSQQSLRLRAGEVLKDEVGDLDRAIAAYGGILEDHGDIPSALEALDELYLRTERWSDLQGVLQLQADNAATTDERVGLFMRLAENAEHRLSQAEEAAQFYTEIFYIDAQNAAVWSQLERLAQAGIQTQQVTGLLLPVYTEQEAWDKVHTVLEMRLGCTDDPVDRGEIVRRLGAINLEHLDRPADAVQWLGQAFELDPTDEELLQRLEGLVRQNGAFRDFSQRLLSVASSLDDPERQIGLWHKAAQILEDDVAEPAEAEQVYQLILNTDADDVAALHSLDHLYVSQERWTELEVTLERLVDTAEFEDDQVETLMRLGALQRDQLGHSEDAVSSFNRVLDINDGNESALMSLAVLYRTQERHQDLFDTLRRLTDVSSADGQRLSHLTEMAQLAETVLDRADDAVDLWEDVLGIDPRNADAIQNQQRMFRSAGEYERLAAALERELGMLGDDEVSRRIQLHRELGTVWAVQLGDSIQAQEAWQQLLRLDATDVEAMQALCGIYESSENPTALADIVERMVASLHFEGDELCGLYMKLARIYTDEIPSPEQAIAAWQKVRGMLPEDMEAVESLERLFMDAGRWEEAVDVLRAKATLADASEVVTVWMSMAEIEQYQLKRWEKAAEAYQSVIAIEPTHTDAGESLEGLYTEHQQWPALASLFEERVAHTDDAVTKRELLIRLAEINEVQLDELPVAFLFLQAAHRENPGDIELLEALERVGGAADSFGELVQEYELALEHTEDDETSTELHLKSARVYRDQLTNATDAIRHFRSVLSLDAENEETLRELASLLRGHEMWDALVEIQQTRFDLAADPNEQVAIGLDVGAIQRDHLSNVDAAVDAFRSVLDVNDYNADAVAALEALFTQNERWEDLIQVLDAKASAGVGEEITIQLQIGEILENRVGDAERAIGCYEGVLELDDTQRQALSRLLDLYAAQNDFDKLVNVYERMLDCAEYDHERLEYCQKLAMLQQQVTGNLESAADYYHRMLSIDPQHTGALSSLEALYEELGHWDDLIDVYRIRLQQLDTAGDEPSETEATDEEAEAEPTAVEQWVDIQAKVANVYRSQLSDTDSAIDAYQRLLHKVPTHWDSLNALEELYREAEQPEAIQEVLERKANAAPSAEARIAIMLERAQIVFEQLHDHNGAIDILNRVLAEEAGNETALALLEQIYTAREEWENVVEVLHKRDLHVSTERQKAGIQREIALIYRDQLHRDNDAVDHLERALELVPDDVEAADILAGLYVQAEDWIKAEALLTLIVNRDGWTDNTVPSHQAEVRMNRGRALEQLLRPEDALLEYEVAHTTDPDNLHALQALARVSMETGDLDRSKAMHSAVIEQIESEADEADLVVHYRALGDIAIQQNDQATACEYLEKTLGIQPNDLGALESLMSLSEKQGNWDEVIRFAVQLLELKSEPLEKFDLQLRIGDVYLNQLQQSEDAVLAYRNALDIQPDSKAAHLKTFQVLVEAESYPEALDTLARLVELEQDERRKGSYLAAMADLYREKLGDPERAIEYFNQSLDCDPSQLKAFRALDEILTDRKDWQALQKNYRSMLVRVQDDPEQSALQYKLCFNLGEIYRTRLKEHDKAVAAFEAALDVQPDDVKSLEILSQLHQVEDEKDKAIACFRDLLREQPGELKHYRALKDLFLETRNKDAAWMACGVLTLLGQADEAETSYYDENMGPDMIATAPSLEGDLWLDHLLSRGENLLLGRIFQTFYQGLGDKLARKTSKEVGVRKKDELDLSQRELFSHVFNTASDVLGVKPVPKVYQSVKSPGVHIEELIPPVLMVGDELRQGRTEQELAFVLGKVLTYLQPLHLVACVAPPESLQTLFTAAAILYIPGYAETNRKQDDAVKSVRTALEDLPNQTQGHIEKMMQEYVSTYQSINVHRWLNQVELSANHAGLYLCNDVVLAGRMLRSESHQTLFTAPSRLTTRDKLVDLAVYALSEEYLSLRQETGIAIE